MRIVIIGNGIAGNSVVEKVREFDKDSNITIISQEKCNTYSACVLAKCLSGEIIREKVFIKNDEDYKNKKIKTIFGHKVIKISPEEKKVYLSNNKNLSYDKLVFATGSSPIMPKIKGSEKKGVFSFKYLDDLDRIISYGPKKIVVVGSGPIGIEVSEAFRKKGCEVHLIEALDWIMPRLFDRKTAMILRDILEKNGVHVKTGERLIEIFGNKKVKGVKTDKGLIECEVVILAIGMRPNVKLAIESGIKIGKLGGIEVDDFLQTNKVGIHACGDCIESKSIIDEEKC